MSNFYDYWFKKDTWSTKQAALLFNGKDPRTNENQIEFPTEIDDFSGVNPGTWQWEVVENYFIFEASNRARQVDGDLEPNAPVFSPREASPLEFLYMALNKGIDSPAKLNEAFHACMRNAPYTERVSFRVLTGRISTDNANLQEDSSGQEDEPISTATTDTEGLPWIKKARELADSLIRDQQFENQLDLAKAVHGHMEKRNIGGRGGKIPAAATIKRRALTGLFCKK